MKAVSHVCLPVTVIFNRVGLRQGWLETGLARDQAEILSVGTGYDWRNDASLK